VGGFRPWVINQKINQIKMFPVYPYIPPELSPIPQYNPLAIVVLMHARAMGVAMDKYRGIVCRQLFLYLCRGHIHDVVGFVAVGGHAFGAPFGGQAQAFLQRVSPWQRRIFCPPALITW